MTDQSKERAEFLQMHADFERARREAENLARSLFNKHYASDAEYASGRVQFGICDSLRGVLSQIDNMTTDLVRAPAVPVPQQALSLLRWAEFLLATSAPMTSQQQEAWPSLQKAADEMRAYQKAMLAVAPLPPEAAPVQLPDCAGKTTAEPNDFDDGDCVSWCGGMPPARGTKLYTEQQVRELLAARGIQ